MANKIIPSLILKTYDDEYEIRFNIQNVHAKTTWIHIHHVKTMKTNGE